MSEYNGWKGGYPTWVINLWMTNDEGSQRYWDERAAELDLDDLADELQAAHEEAMPELDASPYSDLLNWSLGMVDWREIAENMKK